MRFNVSKWFREVWVLLSLLKFIHRFMHKASNSTRETFDKTLSPKTLSILENVSRLDCSIRLELARVQHTSAFKTSFLRKGLSHELNRFSATFAELLSGIATFVSRSSFRQKSRDRASKMSRRDAYAACASIAKIHGVYAQYLKEDAWKARMSLCGNGDPIDQSTKIKLATYRASVIYMLTNTVYNRTNPTFGAPGKGYSRRGNLALMCELENQGRCLNLWRQLWVLYPTRRLQRGRCAPW